MQSGVPNTRRHLRRLVVASVAALFAAGLLQAASTNPYRVIVDANAFRLRPEPATRIEVPPPPPKPQLTAKLTGVTSMFGDKTPRAFLEIQEAGKPTVTRAVLKAGQQSDGVEVVAIDVGQGKVTVRIAGEDSVLTLARMESASVKSAAIAISSVIPRR
jgi:sarcosine oxidase gamma subunit